MAFSNSRVLLWWQQKEGEKNIKNDWGRFNLLPMASLKEGENLILTPTMKQTIKCKEET